MKTVLHSWIWNDLLFFPFFSIIYQIIVLYQKSDDNTLLLSSLCLFTPFSEYFFKLFISFITWPFVSLNRVVTKSLLSEYRMSFLRQIFWLFPSCTQVIYHTYFVHLYKWKTWNAVKTTLHVFGFLFCSQKVMLVLVLLLSAYLFQIIFWILRHRWCLLLGYTQHLW